MAFEIVVVQQRQASSGDELVQLLEPHSRLPLGEVEDKEGIAPWLASLCHRPEGSP